MPKTDRSEQSNAVSVSIVTALAIAALAGTACGGKGKGAAAPSAETTIFSDAPAFASAPVATSAAQAHAAKGLPKPDKTTPCLSCHKEGGQGAPFVFGGTVYSDVDGTKAAPDVEVRVVPASGAAVSVHTDADGNFWSKGAPLTGNAHVGVRSAVKTKLMNGPSTNGDCNTCHAADMPMLLVPPK